MISVLSQMRLGKQRLGDMRLFRAGVGLGALFALALACPAGAGPVERVVVETAFSTSYWYPLPEKDMVAACVDAALAEISRASSLQFEREQGESPETGKLLFQLAIIDQAEMAKLTIALRTPGRRELVATESVSIGGRDKPGIYAALSSLGTAAATKMVAALATQPQEVPGVHRTPSRVVATVAKSHREAAPGRAARQAVQGEVHMIGVYEGRAPAGGGQPWWAECLGADPQVLKACHRTHARAFRSAREVVVNVSGAEDPLVLVLMAYEPVIWVVSLQTDVELERLILAGYHTQFVRGVDASVPTELYTYEASHCPGCVRGDGHFYAYKKDAKYAAAREMVRRITGKSPISFQGAYQGDVFYLTPGTASLAGP